jgi:hypothetical protein
MTNKPQVRLWIIAETEHRRALYDQLSRERATEHKPLTIESPERCYQLDFRMEQPPSGVLLLSWFGAPLTPLLRAALQFTASYSPVLFVIVCNTQESNQEQSEVTLRDEISELNISGDEATILAEHGTLPSQETITRLLAALDKEQTLLSPPREPEPPDSQGDPLSDSLSALHAMIRPARYLSYVLSNYRSLFARPIDTQFGGMPYLERDEEWPICQRNHAPNKMRFLWQIKTNLGLHTFYHCRGHGRNAEAFTIQYYQTVDPSRRRSLPQSGDDPCAYTTEREVREVPNDWKLRLTRSPRPKKSDVYDSMIGLLGVTVERRLSQDMKIGGYNTETRCKSCRGPLAPLLSIGFKSRFSWVLPAPELSFFMCSCSPGAVYPREY